MPHATPAPGTKCIDCDDDPKCPEPKCLATIVHDGAPLCHEHWGGEVCKGVLRASRPAEVIQRRQPVMPAAKPREVESGLPLHKQIVGREFRISGETKAAIVADDPSIGSAKMAQKYGVSSIAVQRIRRDAGVVSTARRGAPPKVRPEPVADLPEVESAPEVVVKGRDIRRDGAKVTQRQRVLEALQGGCETSAEVASETGMTQAYCAAYLADLRKMGLAASLPRLGKELYWQVTAEGKEVEAAVIPSSSLTGHLEDGNAGWEKRELAKLESGKPVDRTQLSVPAGSGFTADIKTTGTGHGTRMEVDVRESKVEKVPGRPILNISIRPITTEEFMECARPRAQAHDGLAVYLEKIEQAAEIKCDSEIDVKRLAKRIGKLKLFYIARRGTTLFIRRRKVKA
jgi:hypothetical protein